MNSRAVLLGQLDRINQALTRHGAEIDITRPEAEAVTETATLRHMVEATARRLAQIIEIESYQVGNIPPGFPQRQAR